MQRRGFLKMLGLAPVAVAAVPLLARLAPTEHHFNRTFRNQGVVYYSKESIPYWIPTERLKAAAQRVLDDPKLGRTVQFFKYELSGDHSSYTATIEEIMTELVERGRVS